ncbi:hypothetical protein ACS0TY_019770 [Phlomoides rotata]
MAVKYHICPSLSSSSKWAVPTTLSPLISKKKKKQFLVPLVGIHLSFSIPEFSNFRAMFFPPHLRMVLFLKESLFLDGRVIFVEIAKPRIGVLFYYKCALKNEIVHCLE